MNFTTLPTAMPRRAVLVFADDARLDLARRRLPVAALPLLRALEFLPGQFSETDVHVFASRAGSAAGHKQFHSQVGHNFAERFENAIETLAALGYEEIVAVGRDCPALAAGDVAHAFEQLHGRRLVLGPDHRGGCYLIAFHVADRALLRGIHWKQNTDCAQLCARAGDAAALLPMKHDIDSWADLELAAQVHEGVARLTAFLRRTIGVGLSVRAPIFHAAAQFVRLHGQIPPPAGAG